MAIVSVANMKGGVAKTTLVVNLAYTLSQRFKKKVLLVDLDPQFNATQCCLSGPEYEELRKNGQPTIYHLFADEDDTVPNLVRGPISAMAPFHPLGAIYRYKPNFDLILGDLNLYRLEFGPGQAREKSLANFIREHGLEEQYDFILIDCPPTPSVWMISALLASDSYLVPVKAEPLSRAGIDLFQGWLNRVITRNNGHHVNCIGVILTIAEEGTKVFRDTKEYLESNDLWRDKLFVSVLNKRTAIARAQAQQEFMLDHEDLRPIIVRITQEFLRRVS